MKSFTRIYKFILFTLFLTGCYNSMSEYDASAYRSLTNLKSEMSASFNTYINSGAKGENDLNAIKKYQEDIGRNYSNAVGREKNKDVLTQLGVLKNNIDEMMLNFQKNDSLSSGYCLEKWNTMEEALNTAIEEKK